MGITALKVRLNSNLSHSGKLFIRKFPAIRLYVVDLVRKAPMKRNLYLQRPFLLITDTGLPYAGERLSLYKPSKQSLHRDYVHGRVEQYGLFPRRKENINSVIK